MFPVNREIQNFAPFRCPSAEVHFGCSACQNLTVCCQCCHAVWGHVTDCDILGLGYRRGYLATRRRRSSRVSELEYARVGIGGTSAIFFPGGISIRAEYALERILLGGKDLPSVATCHRRRQKSQAGNARNGEQTVRETPKLASRHP